MAGRGGEEREEGRKKRMGGKREEEMRCGLCEWKSEDWWKVRQWGRNGCGVVECVDESDV